MLGTSMSLTTARILSYSQRDDFDFEYIKLEAIKADFLQTIKRVGSFDMYKSYQSVVEHISSHKELLSEIDKLGKTFAEKGIDTKKIDLYADYAKRTLAATKESCAKTYQHLLKDFDMLTPNNECKMLMTIQKFDENGNIIPLFKTNENGQIETFVDEHGVERNLINTDILDWSNAEKFYKFANTHNFKIHGHAILWHEAVPYQIQELANSNLPAETKKKMTQDFLYCYMKSYAHNAKVNGIKLESIDILNEIANDDENSDDFLRQSIWRDLMGDDFYIDVLKMAKEAFPDTKLMYNDFSEFYPAKRSNMIQIIQHIQAVEKAEETQLLDCVGLQCHLYGDELDYDTALKEFKEVTQNGSFPQEVRITELDSSPCDTPEWQQTQMQKVVEAANENGLEHITCWEFAGQFSDSIENSANSGIIDENGDESEFYDQLAEKHSENETSSQQTESESESSAE